jgi:hypothetical protein
MKACLFLAACLPVLAQQMPDFNGMWQARLSGLARQYGKPLPFTPFGEKRNKELDVVNDPIGLCLPAGPVRTPTGSPHPFTIVQTKDMLTMLFEYQGTYRIIYTDGRKAPADIEDYPEWMGYSTGHYEGDVLVVETAGINNRNWLDAKIEHSEKLRITERFQKTGPNAISWTVTYTDPMYFKEPVTVVHQVNRSKASERMMSYWCLDDADQFKRFQDLGEKK